MAGSGSGVSLARTASLLIRVPSGTSEAMPKLTITAVATPSVQGMSPSGQSRILVTGEKSQIKGSLPVPPSRSTKALSYTRPSGMKSAKVTSRATEGPILLIT